MLNSKPQTFCDPTRNCRKISIKSCTLITYKPQWGITSWMCPIFRFASEGIIRSRIKTFLGDNHFGQLLSFTPHNPIRKTCTQMQIPLEYLKYTQNPISLEHPKSTQNANPSPASEMDPKCNLKSASEVDPNPLCVSVSLSVSQSHKC